MKLKDIFSLLPTFALSALLFYITIFILWISGILPHPLDIVKFLEGLYNKYGLIGLFISSALEGIVYLGLYFPGTTIMALAVLFSDGSLIELTKIVLMITLALTIASIFNYWLGRNFNFKEKNFNQNGFEKKIIFSILHPNLLSFYFFHRGITKKKFWKIIYVPILIIPYAFIVVYIVSTFTDFIKGNILGNPFITLSLIFLWFMVSFFVKNKKDFTKGLRKIFDLKK